MLGATPPNPCGISFQGKHVCPGMKLNIKEHMKKILCNKIRCKHCGDVIESRTPHEFVTCSCRAVSVDGGHDYLRRVFQTKIEDDYEELSETED